jgi:carboxypeptidase family protein/Big-like domain-containing protein
MGCTGEGLSNSGGKRLAHHLFRMVQLCRALPFLVTVGLSACVGTGAQSLTGPTSATAAPAPAAPTATAIIIATASLTPWSFQLSATARLSDASTRDVTTAARWESADTAIAIVTSSGLVGAVAAGDVEIRAIYQGVVGSAKLTMARPPGASTFALSGIAREVAPNSHPLAGVRIQVTAGADFGLTTTTASDGSFRFPSLKQGLTAVEAYKDGYLLWSIGNWMVDEDKQLIVSLYPIPQKDENGVTASARCTDSTWSWAKLRMLACADSGIAYVVCPGPLCAMPSGQ